MPDNPRPSGGIATKHSNKGPIRELPMQCPRPEAGPAYNDGPGVIQVGSSLLASPAGVSQGRASRQLRSV